MCIRDRENAGRELEDAELKASLKDAGIGTPATRAAIIETLFARQYICLLYTSEIDTANCIHFKLNSVVLNIHIDKKDNAKTNSIAFNIYFSFIFL